MKKLLPLLLLLSLGVFRIGCGKGEPGNADGSQEPPAGSGEEHIEGNSEPASGR